MSKVLDMFGREYIVKTGDPGHEVVKALENAGYQRIVLPAELLLGYTLKEFNIEQYTFDVTAEDKLDTIRFQECIQWVSKSKADSK